MESWLARLLQHLIKWQYQPAYPYKTSWRKSVKEACFRIQRHLHMSPSLRPTVPGLLGDIWGHAVDMAIDDMSAKGGYPYTQSPETCPWTVDQILDPDFWPAEPRP